MLSDTDSDLRNKENIKSGTLAKLLARFAHVPASSESHDKLQRISAQLHVSGHRTSAVAFVSWGLSRRHIKATALKKVNGAACKTMRRFETCETSQEEVCLRCLPDDIPVVCGPGAKHRQSRRLQ